MAPGFFLAALLAVAFLPAVQAGVGASESPDFVINLTGTLDPGAISGYPNTGSAESAVLVLDLRGLGARGASAESAVFAINLAGMGGGLALSGTVLDGLTGQPVAGATVVAGGQTATTGETGTYVMSDLSPGEYRLQVIRQGYAPVTLPLTLQPGSNLRRDVTLFGLEASDEGPRVVSITSRYPGQPHFLEGVKALNAAALPVDFEVEFTANIDWAGHPPGKARFITPSRTYETPALGASVTQRVNVTADFPVGGSLLVVAVGDDGTPSAPQAASLVVTALPLPWLWHGTPRGSDLRYRAAGLNLSFIEQGVEDGVIPEDLPIFGGQAFKLGFIPEIEGEVDGAGRAKLALRWSDLEAGKILDREWGRKHNFGKLSRLMGDFLKKGRLDQRRLPKATVAGMELTLFPILHGELQHNDAAMRWDWTEGAMGLGGEFQFSKSWPFIFLAGPVPVPMYAKFSLRASAEAMLEIQGLEPLVLNGDFQLAPYVRGSLGAGVDQVLAVEGWIGGGADFALQWPEEPTLRELTCYLNGGVTVYALLWTWEKEGLRWDWPTQDGPAVRLAQMETPVPARPLSRDYVRKADYGRFKGGSAKVALQNAGTRKGRRVQLAALQQQVFPYSESSGAAHGTNVMLTWLYDAPERAAQDRTLLVASTYDGADWREPAAVADDGTADFHPRVRTFADGAAVVTWENEGTPMPEAATFEDMLQNLEIAVAWLDPASGVWQSPTALTENDYLDRSPQLAAAARDDVLLTWIANRANHVTGTADQPNEVWFTRWDGAAWAAPALAASVARPILKYDLAYDGNKGVVVFSADTDGDLASVTDHELFSLEFAEGAWTGPSRLTEDQQADENPRLAWDAGGHLVLTWVKGDTVTSAVDLDLAGAKVIHEAEYSSNLADFQLATDGQGRLAVVWAEPSEYSSDLWAMFYDPALQLWGKPKQLTHDAETERQIAPMYFGDDMILAAYDRTLLNVQPVKRVTASGRMATLGIPKPGRTDLFVLTYQFGQDLALKADSLYSLPGNPSPGEQPTLWVTVVNEGDQPVSGAEVAFYRGDPAGEGEEIGRLRLTDSLRPGEETEAPFEWVVPAVTEPIVLFAVVDPEQAFEDADRSNNALSLRLAQADLVVESVTWSQVGESQISVVARVANQGAIVSPSVRLAFQEAGEEPSELYAEAVAPLQPGESRELGFLWDVSALAGDTELAVRLLDVPAEEDFDPSNNAATLVVQRAVVPVDVRFTGLLVLPGGKFQVQVIGPSGRPLRIEASDDLIEWAPVWSTDDFSGQVEWVDPESAARAQRFYRAVAP